MGCTYTCNRKNLHDHLLSCSFNGISKEKDLENRQLLKEAVILECEEERIRRQMHLHNGSGYWSERSEISDRSQVRHLLIFECSIIQNYQISSLSKISSLCLSVCLSLSLILYLFFSPFIFSLPYFLSLCLSLSFSPWLSQYKFLSLHFPYLITLF